MKRSLDHAQLGISCTRGHPPIVMKAAGYYALKEAGAAKTILGFTCPMCHRTLYVTEETPYALDAETRNAMDTTP